MEPLPKLAVFKFSSCDGCQLSLLDLEDELLAIAAKVEIANFMEASSRVVNGPYDLSLIEGSITTPGEAKKIQEIRKQSRVVVTIGACATSGGIQALRNGKNIPEWISTVYAKPEFIDTLETSTAISEHILVDFELRGCPVSKFQLLEVVNAFVNHRKPVTPNQSVCNECKLQGLNCVMVTKQIPCMGPITHAGCEALCPKYSRGCFGCFGIKENAELTSFKVQLQDLGMSPELIDQRLNLFRHQI